MEKDHLPGQSAEILQINDVSKTFGYRRILSNVHLRLQSGEMTLLLGKNGSGKTTLMKIIAGLMRPSAGRILYRGAETSQHPEALRRGIGVISHFAGVYGELTASENLVFFGKLGKSSDLKEKVSRSLERTGLSQFSDLPVKSFSSGMSKRLNIARLMVLEPEILLLDEPYTGLDYDSIRFFNDYLNVFKASGGAILMITHQIETCFDICDKIAILENQSLKRSFSAVDYSREELIQAYHSLTR
ncbi:MAG: heme ABC exporter ATP-binding protein CcmA [bacterium]